MSVTMRDVLVGAASLLAFPVAINLTAFTASGDSSSPEDAPSRQDPAPQSHELERVAGRK